MFKYIARLSDKKYIPIFRRSNIKARDNNVINALKPHLLAVGGWGSADMTMVSTVYHVMLFRILISCDVYNCEFSILIVLRGAFDYSKMAAVLALFYCFYPKLAIRKSTR